MMHMQGHLQFAMKPDSDKWSFILCNISLMAKYAKFFL